MDKSILMERIIKEHQGLFYKIAYTYMRSHEEAEDIIQTSYQKAYENLDGLKNKTAMKQWLLTIIRNESNRRIRQMISEKNNHYSSEIIDVQPNFDESINTRLDISFAIHQLSEDHRNIIILKYYAGYKQKEIAKALDLPNGTVKSRISRALVALSLILGGDSYEH